jgi:hypothetical protein
MSKAPYDLEGKKFGRLLVLEPVKVKSNNGGRHWRCKCDCGGTAIVRTSHLTSGHTVSCGCRKEEVKKEIDKAHDAVRAKSKKKKELQRRRTTLPPNLMDRLVKAEAAMRAFRMDNLRLQVQVKELQKKLKEVCATPVSRYGADAAIGDPRCMLNTQNVEGALYGTKWDNDLY